MKFFLVLLLLVYCCHGTISCPELCTCYPRRAEVVCNEVPLTDFPSEDLPRNTTSLSIQFTNISFISEDQLTTLPALEELHLYHNQLKRLPSNLFRGVPRLRIVDLTGNQLDHLPEKVFSHAPLQSLVLKRNLIQSADAEWLPEDSNVTWLDLSKNRLTAAPTALLQRLHHLEILDLSHNRLEKLAADSLSPLTKLERLNLQGNKLSKLEPATFSTNGNLTHLYLSENRLEKLPLDVFEGLHSLKDLSLNDNRLSHIPPGVLDHLISLEWIGLDLTLNPWVCDGKMEYLWRWLQKNKEKTFLVENTTCASPKSLKERPVLSLTESDLV
ncbi:leucine-rich alpha-2-glycoprotein [Hypomesus transpacificus]|uniref:leucine-rich alpha-2-glycoprotein n=1 Tax=Hypomesus transpacificus TaxID=137520 RepID=UPI001F083DC7|nr:leucine-rich alpha-2-glycoprotein [Hypomesus transpacificus]